MIFDSGAVLCVSLAIFLDAACDFVGLHRSATIGTGRTNRVVVKATIALGGGVRSFFGGETRGSTVRMAV